MEQLKSVSMFPLFPLAFPPLGLDFQPAYQYTHQHTDNSSKGKAPKLFTGVPVRKGAKDNRNGNRGFDTTVAPMMVGVADKDVMGNPIKVEIDPVFTVGETVNDYTAPGILDGIGAYKLNGNTVRVLVNHELSPDRGYGYQIGNLTLTGARISHFDIDIKTRTIVDAGLAYNTIYDREGKLVTLARQINENGDATQGFDRFCSAQLFEANVFGKGYGFVDRLYITGEETDNGSFWILDTAKGDIWAAPDLGRGAWESATALNTGTTDKIALLLGDDEASAPLYLYIGTKGVDVNNDGKIDFLERNGLRGGDLYVWKSNTGELDPESFNGTGSIRNGSWVKIAVRDVTKAGQAGYDSLGYKDDVTLRAEADSLGAFSFSRPEDLHTNPSNGTQAVFASTGRGQLFPSDNYGTTYLLDTAFNSNGAPVLAKITILYDGDDADKRTAGLRSADNLVWANDGLIYVQEDKSTFSSVGGFGTEEASIWQLDPKNPGQAVRIAQVDRSAIPLGQTDTAPADIGNWETSGIIDVSSLFGLQSGSLFLFDIQAHSLTTGNIASQGLVQGGQLAFLEISR